MSQLTKLRPLLGGKALARMAHALNPIHHAAFSTTGEQAFSQNLETAMLTPGPKFLITKKKTEVRGGDTTKKEKLPIGVKVLPSSHEKAPGGHDWMSLKAKYPAQFSQTSAGVGKMVFKTKLDTEMDVISKTAPYFENVVFHGMEPYLLEMGYHGDYDFDSDLTIKKKTPRAAKGKHHDLSPHSIRGDRPDKVLRYEGRAIAVLDYKGPACVQPEEVQHGDAKSIKDAEEKLKSPEFRLRATNKAGGGSLLDDIKVTEDTRFLIQQLIKYCRQLDCERAFAYDEGHILAIYVPQANYGKDGWVADVVLLEEKNKATEESHEMQEETHNYFATRFCVNAIIEHDKKHKGFE